MTSGTPTSSPCPAPQVPLGPGPYFYGINKMGPGLDGSTQEPNGEGVCCGKTCVQTNNDKCRTVIGVGVSCCENLEDRTTHPEYVNFELCGEE